MCCCSVDASQEHKEDGCVAPMAMVVQEDLPDAGDVFGPEAVVLALAKDGREDLPVKEFSFVVHRLEPSMPLGVTLDPAGSRGIHVSAIDSGETAVNEANAASFEFNRLQAGDYIVEVNGLTGDQFEMLEELETTTGALTLRVVRAVEFEVLVVRKRRGSLGCAVSCDAGSGGSLVIDGVHEGPLQDWNVSNPDRLVEAGDRILSANGKTGSSTELLDIIKAADGDISLRLSRPAVH